MIGFCYRFAGLVLKVPALAGVVEGSRIVSIYRLTAQQCRDVLHVPQSLETIVVVIA
jgi:hypothetical protein